MIDLERLFHKILRPALGCTEPAAVAYAAAAASRAAGGWTPDWSGPDFPPVLPEHLRRVQVTVNRNIFKNSFSVVIPNTEGRKGILTAAALGPFCDPGLKLGLFSVLNAGLVAAADRLIAERAVQVEVAREDPTGIFIDALVTLETGQGLQTGRCIIRGDHSAIVLLHRDGRMTYQRPGAEMTGQPPDPDLAGLKAMGLAEVVSLVENLPESVLDLIRKTIAMNTRAYQTALEQPLGIGAGFYRFGCLESEDVFCSVALLAAAGSDARMSGYPVEVMSSAGSGNQGITATIPVAEFARRQGISESRMLRAVALSHLVTMYLTQYIGYLSALCGVAIKAGIGAACGAAYALGGDAGDVERALKVMAATLTGMICDGAKAGCALKVGTTADMAIRAAILATKNVEVPDDNGIVARTPEETIMNLAKLGTAMEMVDQQILEIMKQKMNGGDFSRRD